MLEVCVLALLTLALPRDCGEDTKHFETAGEREAHSFTEDDRS